MKIMSRDFTTAEKVLLVGLALILVGLAYYYFVDTPVRNAIASSEAEVSTLQGELATAQKRLSYLEDIQKNIDDLQNRGDLGWMGSYNNSNVEVKFLNDVLANTKRYSINFANVLRNGDQIRRNFTLQFSTQNYAEAQEILTQLLEGENRCLVGDMSCTINTDGSVNLTATATFYETMVGGTPDAGLPVDGAGTKK